MIMKKFTIVSSLLFVLLFCGMVGYVASSEDFTPPKEEEEAVVPEEEDREAPVWNTTVDELVSFLEEKGLIEEAGRMELPGRPIAFRTTAAFLRCFGLSDLSELPDLQPPEDTEDAEAEEQLGFDDLAAEEEK